MDIGEQLVGTLEIGVMLGLTRQRVNQLAADPQSGFPAPVATLAAGRVWWRPDIVRWARNTGRPVLGEPGHGTV